MTTIATMDMDITTHINWNVSWILCKLNISSNKGHNYKTRVLATSI